MVRNSTRAKSNDASSGYEAVASEFMRARSLTGVAVVRRWAGALAPGATVLDLGCGHGVPLTSALIDDGLTVYGIDASPTLVAAFRDRFPHAEVACEAVERSSFFHRTFDGVIAVGLIFLMSAEAQRDLIRRVAQVLNPGGRFLFTSPAEACAWTDILSSHRSLSLGAADYKAALAGAGLTLVDEYLDEGDNHYFDARKEQSD